VKADPKRPKAPQKKKAEFFTEFFFFEERLAELRQMEATLTMGTELFFVLKKGVAKRSK
jgi:hypothetical protein